MAISTWWIHVNGKVYLGLSINWGYPKMVYNGKPPLKWMISGYPNLWTPPYALWRGTQFESTPFLMRPVPARLHTLQGDVVITAIDLFRFRHLICDLAPEEEKIFSQWPRDVVRIGCRNLVSPRNSHGLNHWKELLWIKKNRTVKFQDVKFGIYQQIQVYTFSIFFSLGGYDSDCSTMWMIIFQQLYVWRDPSWWATWCEPYVVSFPSLFGGEDGPMVPCIGNFPSRARFVSATIWNDARSAAKLR